jgi:hypothetical protein
MDNADDTKHTHIATRTLPLLRFISATLEYTWGVRAGDEGCDMPTWVGAWKRDVITSEEAASKEEDPVSGHILQHKA